MRDYFSFDVINDKEGNTIAYHLSVVGTIEEKPELRSFTVTNEGEEVTRERAFGKIRLHNCSKRLDSFMRLVKCRVDSEMISGNDSEDILSFAVRGLTINPILELEEGDRVLLEGRAYIRKNGQTNELGMELLPELSITVNDFMILSQKHNLNSYGRNNRSRMRMVPQKEDSEEVKETDDDMFIIPTIQGNDNG